MQHNKETFKYHMTLRGKGVCSNRQSAVIWGRSWPNRHITFVVAEKG